MRYTVRLHQFTGAGDEFAIQTNGYNTRRQAMAYARRYTKEPRIAWGTDLPVRRVTVTDDAKGALILDAKP
jgi:hypothetical protein